MAVVASEGLMGVMVAKGVVAEMAGAAYRAEMRRVQRSSRTPPAALPTRLRLCKLVAAAAASANAASGHAASGHEASADGADESSANAASADGAGGANASAASATEAVASCSAEGCCRRGSAPCWFYRTRRSSGTEGMGLSRNDLHRNS